MKSYRAMLETEATLTGGVYRWKSNGSVPPAEVLESATREGLAIDLALNAAARSEELRAFFAEYRARQPKEPSAEQRAEARAAHGPGVVLVDVISGRRFTT
jgi:hypothetical protein